MDKRIKNLLDRMNQDNGIVIVTDGNLARLFGQQSKIRKLRKNGRIFIAKDHKKDVSLIYKTKC